MTASRIRGTGRLNPDGVIDRIDPRVPDDEALDDAADAAGGGPATTGAELEGRCRPSQIERPAVAVHGLGLLFANNVTILPS